LVGEINPKENKLDTTESTNQDFDDYSYNGDYESEKHLSVTEVVPTKESKPYEVNYADDDEGEKSYPKIESEWTYHKIKDDLELDIETQPVERVTTTTSTTTTTTSTRSTTTITTTTTTSTFATTSKPSPAQIFTETIKGGGNATTSNTSDGISSNITGKVPASLEKDEEAFKAYSLLVNWISKYTSNVPDLLINKTKEAEKEKEDNKEYKSFLKMFQQVSSICPNIPMLIVPKKLHRSTTYIYVC